MSRSLPVDASAPDLGGEHRPESPPPEPHSFVANIDTALMGQVLDIPQQQRESDVEHDRQTDNLGRGFELTKPETFGYARTLPTNSLHLMGDSSDSALTATWPGLKSSSSDNTPEIPPRAWAPMNSVEVQVICATSHLRDE